MFTANHWPKGVLSLIALTQMKNLFTALFVISTSCAFALNPSDFKIQLVSEPYFVVNGNSPTADPQSAYVGFEIKNICRSTTYTNLKFTITSTGTSVIGQNYSLISLASGITLMGTLAPGETKACYYQMKYPANATPSATFNCSLTDATAQKAQKCDATEAK